jgi:hypothetical protein
MKKIGTIFTTATFLFVMAIASVSATAADTAAQDNKDSMASTDMGMDQDTSSNKDATMAPKKEKKDTN